MVKTLWLALTLHDTARTRFTRWSIYLEDPYAVIMAHQESKQSGGRE